MDTEDQEEQSRQNEVEYQSRVESALQRLACIYLLVSVAWPGQGEGQHQEISTYHDSIIERIAMEIPATEDSESDDSDQIDESGQ